MVLDPAAAPVPIVVTLNHRQRERLRADWSEHSPEASQRKTVLLNELFAQAGISPQIAPNGQPSRGGYWDLGSSWDSIVITPYPSASPAPTLWECPYCEHQQAAAPVPHEEQWGRCQSCGGN